MAKPSASSAASAAAISVRLEPERRGERALRDRTQALQPAAHDLDQRLLRAPLALGMAGGSGDRRDRARASGQSARNCGSRSAAIQSVPAGRCSRAARFSAVKLRRASRSSRLRPGLPPRVRKPSQTSASCSSSRFVASGQASARTRAIASGSSRPRSAAVSGIEPAPGHDGLRAALLQRRVVEIGVGPRRQHLERQRRRLGQVARDHADLAGLDAGEQALQALDVHRLGQAVGDRLVHQRMVGHLALADQVLGAGDLVGKDACDQVLGVHARELRRHLAAAAEARQRQRDARDPAPARDEHRRIEQRLDQHAAARSPNADSARPRRARSCARW